MAQRAPAGLPRGHRATLAVDDEEELLQMQEQFAAQKDARPAAKVTRVSRGPPRAAAATTPAAAATPPGAQPQACAVHGPSCQGHHQPAAASADQQQQAADLMAAMQAAFKGIVGEVQERPVAAGAPPPLPTAAAAAAAGAFPAATHRKLSKFALGRQQQRSAGAAAAVPAAASALVDAAGPAAGGDDASSIDAENQQVLAGMTPEQLAEAREEVLQRLGPAAVEFLRRRGAEKAAAAQAAPAAAAAPPAAAVAPAQQGPTAGMQAGRQAPAGSQRPQQGRLAPAAGSAATPQASLAARLRFDVDGQVVGLRPPGPDVDVAPAEEEGLAGTGYSVQEACLLARSSVPQQRALALRLLASVLALSRPSIARSRDAAVPLPPAVAAELRGEGRQARLEWTAVWHHALHAAEVVVLLRRSLDDAHPLVSAAATEALAALLGACGPAAAAEEAAAEAADACPLAGWPAAPARHLQRPTGGGGWVAAPAAPRQHEDWDEEDGGEAEALDERQLAKVDPLTSLLHMHVLPRAVYLVGAARAAGALDPLLSILIKLCQAGKDVADQVLESPGMLSALKEVLDAPPPPPPGATSAAAAAVAPDATAAAYYAARPKALRLLRQLAQASRAAARGLQEAGLVRFALDQLLRPAGMALEAAPGAARKQRGQLAEALRLWRAFGQHGFYLLLLDDAYPSLCAYFTPPEPPAAALAAAQAGAAAPAAAAEALQQWCVAREAYSAAAQLCWHAARGEQHDSQLSPQCAAALAEGTVSWLQGLPLQQLLDACSGSDSSADSTDSSQPALGSRVGPYPALAAAASASSSGGSAQAVLLSTLAAALHFVGSYWSVQAWHTAAEKAAAAEQLAALGVLPRASTPGSLPGALQSVQRMLGQVVAAVAVWQLPAVGGTAAPVAAAELAVALSRLAAAFLPQQQAATVSASLLAPLCSPHAAVRFWAAAAAADTTLSQPWDVAQQMQLLPLARAAATGLQAAAPSSELPPGAADTAQALLQFLPPGDEPVALQLLAALLGPKQLASTTAAAAAALQAAASGKVGQLLADGEGPPAMPDVAQLSPLLLAGYAGPWLALVPEGQQGRQPAASGPEPPPNTALLRPQGSRLPLPADWAVHELPQPPTEAHIACGPGPAAEGALVLALGWQQQQQQQPGSGAAAAALAEQQLRSAALLLLGEQQPQEGSGIVPGAPLGAIGEEEEDDAAPWERPLARWCLAALMEGCCATAAAAGDGAPAAAAATADDSSGVRGWQQQEARQLAERFGAVSYGDRLFGATTALTLRRSVPLDLEVLSTLADEQALHLLPPLRLLPGPPAAYLNQPGSGAGGFATACFGAAQGAGGPGTGSSRRQELDLYLRLLSHGALERCLAAAVSSGEADSQAAASEGDGSSCASCSVAVPLVLHRLCCACFPDAAGSSGEAGSAAQQGLLCSILQHCGGSQSSELQRLLGMLLRWDAAAMQPSDALSQQRVAAIEAACAAAGLDAAQLLQDALEA